jgi:hypothetical protein
LMWIWSGSSQPAARHANAADKPTTRVRLFTGDP